MFDDGVIHDILWNDVLGKVLHLELRCIPCTIQTTSGKISHTRKWLTKSLKDDLLELISIAINKKTTGDIDDNDEALKALNTKGRDPVQVLEGPSLRLACVFRSDEWAADRQKVISSSEKLWLSGDKIVVSAALIPNDKPENDVLNQTLFREVGALQEVPETTNTISKYFSVIKSA